MTPTIHMNGTSASDLIDQQLAVVKAARELRRALARAAPNGRDFYPQGDDALREARKAYDVEAAQVVSIISNHEAILEALVDQTEVSHQG